MPSKSVNIRAILDQLVITGKHQDALDLAHYFFVQTPSAATFDLLCFTCAQTREFGQLGHLLDQHRHTDAYQLVVARRTAQHLQFLKVDETELNRLIGLLEATGQAGAIFGACRALLASGNSERAARHLGQILPKLPLVKWPFHLLAGFRRTAAGEALLEKTTRAIRAEDINANTIWAVLYLHILCGYDLVADTKALVLFRRSPKRSLTLPFGQIGQDVKGLMSIFNTLEGYAKSFHVNETEGAQSAHLVLDDIMAAVEAKQPLSLIRLGDGDGNFLERPADHPMARFDQFNMARDFWGLSLDDATLKGLSERMYQAVASADIIGIPDIARLSRQNANFVEAFGPQRERRGLTTILEVCLEQRESLSDKRLVSCHIHQAMQKQGFFDQLCSRIKSLHLVSCHPHLKAQIEDQYPITVTLHETPIQFVETHKLGRTVSENNIEAFERLIAGFPADMSGEVVLVAAGFYGRLMTRDVRDRGGIAIDIGSIANEWMGVSTRMEGLELKAMQKSGLGG